MEIRIVTDSTCDLPKSIVERHAIIVIPQHIHQGSQTFLDGVNITREEFYAHLPGFRPAPTTATPSPEIFQQAWEKLADAGAHAILSIHISENLSATVNSARTAAKQFTRIPVMVLDSSSTQSRNGVHRRKSRADGRTRPQYGRYPHQLTRTDETYLRFCFT